MSYQKIPNLYRVKDLFSNFAKLYASEKVHGTSAHISYTPAKAEAVELEVGSIEPTLLATGWGAEAKAVPAVPSKLTFFSGGADHAAFVRIWTPAELIDMLGKLESFKEPVTIYGEAYGGKLQGMRDTYGDALKFIVFEVKVGDTWLNMEKAFSVANYLGLEFVPFKIIDATPEAIDAAMLEASAVAVRRGITEMKQREGIVLRPLEEFTMNNGARVIAKHKHPDFSENRKVRTLVDPELSAPEEKLAEDYCTDMRFFHVLDKFTEPRMPESIAKFIEAFKADCKSEAPMYEAEQLNGRHAVKVLSRFAAERFKRMMRES
jgi:hypothetical protein